ncbi:Endonuclease/exonuclease/phosphatase [Phellopilus nigrolimitatus]|nr:Endonuclease/exonuclease/phosphatase [Phellopilus nigrolimitatus]
MFSALYTKCLGYVHSVPLPPCNSSPQFLTFYEYSEESLSWNMHPMPPPPPPISSEHTSPNTSSAKLKILTWNVDAFSKNPDDRLSALLLSLEAHASIAYGRGDICYPDVLLLQEVHPKALPALLAHPLVQMHYLVSDVGGQNGRNNGSVAQSGMLTLVHRSSPLFVPAALYMISLPSHKDRVALVCDLLLRDAAETADGKALQRVRIANVHLDSQKVKPSWRRRRLEIVMEHLQVVGAGIVMGDFHAVSPEDERLSQSLGLEDGWATLHGQDRKNNGHTWGVQKKEALPPGRRDRAASLNLRAARAEVVKCGKTNKTFWSDHCGLWVEFEFKLFKGGP